MFKNTYKYVSNKLKTALKIYINNDIAKYFIIL